jgi:hypothetical protein
MHVTPSSKDVGSRAARAWLESLAKPTSLQSQCHPIHDTVAPTQPHTDSLMLWLSTCKLVRCAACAYVLAAFCCCCFLLMSL